MDFLKELKDNFVPKAGTGETALEAIFCTVEKICYYLFKTPYVAWTLANKRLAEIRKEGFLDITKIDSVVPFIVYWFRFFIFFLIYALQHMCVVLAPVVGIVAAVVTKEWTMFFAGMIGSYYATLSFRLLLEIVILICKYAKYLWIAIKFIFHCIMAVIRFVLLPFRVLYQFFNYLQAKCACKVAKYEKRTAEINKPAEK